MDIQAIGSYIYPNKDGFLVNTLNPDLIQSEWKPVTDAVIEVYRDEFGSNLQSVYLRGSVAKGTAIKSVSDIDTMAVVDISDRVILNTKFSLRNNRKRSELSEFFPFVTGFETNTYLLSEVFESPDFSVLLKLFGINVYGEDVLTDFPQLKPGKDVYLHLPRIIVEIENLLTQDIIPERKIIWIMKRILRSSMELYSDILQRHSRDLYYCTESWKEADTSMAPLANKCLRLAINPIEGRETIQEALSYFRSKEY